MVIFTKKPKKPRLTVRSAAEMLNKPDEALTPLLYGQKYPDNGDGAFRLPYYQHAIAGIREFFRSGNSALIEKRAEIQGFRQESRRDHNYRVLESFENSKLVKRKLMPLPNSRFYAQVGDVELRLSPDIQATENGERRVIYFNCKNVEYSAETATQLVEIAYWVLRQNGVDIRPDQIEFVDLFSRKSYTVDALRAKTLDSLSAEAMQVTRIWQDL